MAMGILTRHSRPSIFASDAVQFVCKTCRRNAATYRRTRKALRVKTNASFAPSITETQDHIIFNPPSSVPNVYHTPAKFLPKSDPRRVLLQDASSASTPAPASTSIPTSALASIAAARLSQHSSRQFTPVREEYQKRYHLKPDQIEEIRRLRSEDPRQWSIRRLAEKFDCSEFFISLCSKSSEMGKEHEMKLEETKRRWGRRKTEAREDRQERKKLWGMDA